ncbi:MAG: ribosomal protein small subunit ribosomal protein [Candidatus Parcubacteria bacterium]|jgi:small subunit ribosomal protein S4
MKLGPKYKIARRLGAPIFEKTQTQKFKMRAGEKSTKKPMTKSEFARQMIEKQKARFTYGISEKQFSRYVKDVIESGSHTPSLKVFEALETRLDNVVFRLGLASTRRFARQIVSHGHITVNGQKVTIPSYVVRPGDQLAVREGSKTKTVFKELDAKMKDTQTPVWLTWNTDKKQASVLRLPSIDGVDLLFDLGAVLEFYKR